MYRLERELRQVKMDFKRDFTLKVLYPSIRADPALIPTAKWLQWKQCKGSSLSNAKVNDQI